MKKKDLNISLEYFRDTCSLLYSVQTINTLFFSRSSTKRVRTFSTQQLNECFWWMRLRTLAISVSSFTHSFSLNNNVNLCCKISIVVRTELTLKSLSTEIFTYTNETFWVTTASGFWNKVVSWVFVCFSHTKFFYIYFTREKKALFLRLEAFHEAFWIENTPLTGT
jgi:hypothetical protein